MRAQCADRRPLAASARARRLTECAAPAPQLCGFGKARILDTSGCDVAPLAAARAAGGPPLLRAGAGAGRAGPAGGRGPEGRARAPFAEDVRAFGEPPAARRAPAAAAAPPRAAERQLPRAAPVSAAIRVLNEVATNPLPPPRPLLLPQPRPSRSHPNLQPPPGALILEVLEALPCCGGPRGPATAAAAARLASAGAGCAACGGFLEVAAECLAAAAPSMSDVLCRLDALPAAG